ncbi:mediator of RNA polymerase II transcription subunit 16 [Papilio machaon]|uniref:mediator of RNA polymerase II transcription subunit 16 n=1 Tax=Papilio machaon TaxID=76193 RepID=UPI001E665F9E|nr:mediator of RNA polymerase II transcription subunit 16 [Papilio machaon]
MELIYSMRRKPLKCEPPHYENNADPEVVRPICTISTCNIIAFSSLTELSDTDGDTWGGHIYVCDLDTPWECHKVASTVYPVSALEWDGEGKQLLVATVVGEVSVYAQKDYLLNEWTCLYSAYFPGENIIKAVFFHNGRKVIAVEKKPDVPISDRIQMLRSVPTLKGFGGIACEGACIITGTGLVGALTPAGDSNRALVASDCLRSPRDHIATASFAHKNGSILIAAAWRGGGKRGVRCAACAVFRPPGTRAAPVQLTLQPLPTVYLLDHEPVSITWCLREDTDSLLIAGSTLTLWKLAERSYPVHKLLCKGPVQGNTTPGGGPKAPTDCFNTVVWQQTAVWQVEGGGATYVGSVRLPLATPHVLLATPTALHLLNRDNHHYVCSRAIGTGLVSDTGAATPPKKTKYGGLPTTGWSGATLSCVEVSQLGAVCVAVDTHSQLHVFKLSQPAPDIPTTLTVQHTTLLLEYAMVSGYDCLDVLMTLKPNIVEAVYERLTESFQRQSQAFQQYYYHSWLKLRIALCSRVAGLTGSAASLCSLQLVLAGWSAAAAALRPDDKTEAALASLAALANMPDEHDEKNLLALEAKAESLGEGATSAGSAWGALSAMQPLYRPLQRALDTALTTLASLPTLPTAPHHHGYEMWSDAVALNVLRKMVVIARACARGGDALSRPLARLAAVVGATPKPDLLEECAALTAQMPARVWDALPRCTVSAPHGRPWPLQLEYDMEPEALRFVPEPPAHAQCDGTPSLAMDSIRYMYLGGGRRAARWRRCGRCGARSVPAALPAPLPARNAQQRAYDARYLAACRCGGKWTLYSNI